jgi:hypothetical protein
MSRANPLWGAPRIHGELLKLGIDVSQPTVAKYMLRHRKPVAARNPIRPLDSGVYINRSILRRLADSLENRSYTRCRCSSSESSSRSSGQSLPPRPISPSRI